MTLELTPDVLKTFDVMQAGNAYNTQCVDHTVGVTDLATQTRDLLSAFGFAEFAPHAAQLDYYTSGPLLNLKDHLEDHFANLPTRLGLVSGYINDLSDMSRLPGWNLPNSTRSVAGGGFVNLSSVSPRAMMLGAPWVMMMADTGSGTGGSASSSSGKCASMGNAFGSIMGKASQFMGQAMGSLGQIQGLMGGVMGGGMLGAISKFANVGSLGNIPGIGNLGSLVSGGFANVGNLGQMGSLLTNIGSMANIGQMGQLGSLIGGNMGSITQLGGLISQMAGTVGQAQNVAGGLGQINPVTVQNQLAQVQNQITNLDVGTLAALCIAVAARMLEAFGENVPAGPVGDTIEQLSGLGIYLTQGNLTQLGDLTNLINGLNALVPALQTYVEQTPEVIALIADIQQLVVRLAPLSNISGVLANINTVNTQLQDFGGLTGYGNPTNLMGTAQSLVGSLGGLASVPGLSSITGALGSVQGLVGKLGGLASGNISGLLGSMGGLGGGLQGIMGSLGGAGGLQGILGSLGGAGGLGSILGGAGLGGITSQLSGLLGGGAGGLGGIMGGVSGMIGGEKGMLSKATGSLQAIAGSINLKLLGKDACASGVLGNVASPDLKAAMGTDGTTTGSVGTSDFSGSAPGADKAGSSEPSLPAPDDSDFGKGSVYDPSISGQKPTSFADLPPSFNVDNPAPFSGQTGMPTQVDGVPQDLPTKGDGYNPYAPPASVVDGVPQDLPTKGDGTNPYAGNAYGSSVSGPQTTSPVDVSPSVPVTQPAPNPQVGALFNPTPIAQQTIPAVDLPVNKKDVGKLFE